MNKRHYEHTLPNIRGSLSNTYYKWASGLYKNFNYEDKKGIAPACLPREKETG